MSASVVQPMRSAQEPSSLTSVASAAQDSRARIPDRDMLEKYYTHEFTYNEYPHKSFWSTAFGAGELGKAFETLGRARPDVSQLLFVNVPFCKRQCLFCICHTVITQDYGRIRRYLGGLAAELRMIRQACDARGVDPDIREVHVGGGSPTLLTHEDFDRLVEEIHGLVGPCRLGRFSLEVDPRGVKPEDLEFYARCGVNRLSFGIQDFDPEVQKAIGRIQPPRLVERLLAPSIRGSFDGVNFDILCGLPCQTRQSFRRTIETAIGFEPDRVMLMFLNYCPGIKRHQTLIDRAQLPALELKMEMFFDAVERLDQAGYVRIGPDHFARPGDDLAVAYRDKAIHWNSLGYRPGRCVGMIGAGAGSLGRITDEYYYQNIYDLEAYEQTVAGGRLPVYRGYRLQPDDRVRRDVIHRLRCYLSVDFEQIERNHGIDFREYFKEPILALQPMVEDGIVEVSDRALALTGSGKIFTSYVCGLFDRFMGRTAEAGS